MPVATSDLAHHVSTSAGSSGGVIAGTYTSGVKNNIWPDVSDAERIAGGDRYRKTFWKNNHGTDALLAPVVFFNVAPVNCTLLLGWGISDASDDDPAQGNMTAFAAPAVVSVESDGADTRQVTIVGLDNSGTPVPMTENVVLNGTTPVLSSTTWSKVHAVYVASTSASRIVTVKQGSGGPSRGVIGLNKKLCWLWQSAGTTKASGLQLPDLPAGQNIGVWRKKSWTAGAGAIRPNTLSITIEEN